MMNISEIKQYFENNFPKKSLKELSINVNNNESLVNLQNLSYDFDSIKSRRDKVLKTSDTIYFRNDKITFVEFKSGKVGNYEYRFKAFESIISFYNYIYENGFKDAFSVPNDIFEIYFVHKRTSKYSSLQELQIIEKELSKEYKHLYSKFKLIDIDQFQKIFKPK